MACPSTWGLEVERLALNEKMMIEVLYEVLSASFWQGCGSESLGVLTSIGTRLSKQDHFHGAWRYPPQGMWVSIISNLMTKLFGIQTVTGRSSLLCSSESLWPFDTSSCCIEFQIFHQSQAFQRAAEMKCSVMHQTPATQTLVMEIYFNETPFVYPSIVASRCHFAWHIVWSTKHSTRVLG